MQYNLLWFVWAGWFYLIIYYGFDGEDLFTDPSPFWKRGMVVILSFGLCYVLYLVISSQWLRTMFKRKEQKELQIEWSDDASDEPIQHDMAYTGDAAGIVETPPPAPLIEQGIAVIPSTCVIIGEFNSTSDIHVNGRIDGIIRSEKTVCILKSGHVEGDIIADVIAIDGTLNGNCVGDEVSINEKGVVNGTITSNSLAIHKDGRFHGQSQPRSLESESQVVDVRKISEKNIV